MDFGREPDRLPPEYLEELRRLGPAGRLELAIELSENAKATLIAGLRMQFPHLSELELAALYRRQVDRCDNQRS